MKLLKSHKCFQGQTQFWEHFSQATKTPMKFSTFVPQGEVRGCIIWLSGLTCTEENFITKAGAQRYLAESQLMVLCPDTSPRGLNLPHEHDASDFGSGAGFYVNAVTAGYQDHYRMYSYIVDELYQLIATHFSLGDQISIMGHSMGGHGALTIGLREKDKFKAISAFAPIVNPIRCSWGIKAFNGYFGDRMDLWLMHDACELIKAGHTHPRPILVDQGTKDGFLVEGQLLTQNLAEVCRSSEQALQLRYQEDYDHSYYFIATFIEDHIRFHAQALLPSDSTC